MKTRTCCTSLKLMKEKKEKKGKDDNLYLIFLFAKVKDKKVALP